MVNKSRVLSKNGEPQTWYKQFSQSEMRKDMLHLIAQYRRQMKASGTFQNGKSTETYKAMKEAEEATTNLMNDMYKKYRPK